MSYVFNANGKTVSHSTECGATYSMYMESGPNRLTMTVAMPGY